MLPPDPLLLSLLLLLIFLVAAAYSSVGHGGASGYLAILSFFGFAPAAMAPGALLLNLLVAALSFSSYARAGHFTWRLLWPFLLASIPAAFLGGFVGVPPKVYLLLLAVVLTFAAARLILSLPSAQKDSFLRPPSLAIALPAGAAIGLLSGVIGVGGGIFLSPLLILFRWADAKRTAAVSAAFIWVNSAAGLYGQLLRKSVDWHSLAWLVGAAFAGGVVGSWLGAQKLQSFWLRRILGVILLLATIKLLRSAF